MHCAVPLLRQQHSWYPLDLFQFTGRTENLPSRYTFSHPTSAGLSERATGQSSFWVNYHSATPSARCCLPPPG